MELRKTKKIAVSEYAVNVANTILNQLGGGDFIKIMGIQMGDLELVSEGGDIGLGFVIKAERNISNYTSIKIILRGNDLYDVFFCDRNGNVGKRIEGCYNDMLSNIILEETGVQIPEYDPPAPIVTSWE